MKNIGKAKTLSSAALVLVLVVAIAGSVSAYIYRGYMWNDYFSTVSRTYHFSDYYSHNIWTAQKIINNVPDCPDLYEDGIFGYGTQTGVGTFQQLKGLYNDGVVGPNTWNRLQYRLAFESTHTDGYDYYWVDTTVSDYGPEHTPLIYFRHQTNGRWGCRRFWGDEYYTIVVDTLP